MMVGTGRYVSREKSGAHLDLDCPSLSPDEVRGEHGLPLARVDPVLRPPLQGPVRLRQLCELLQPPALDVHRVEPREMLLGHESLDY